MQECPSGVVNEQSFKEIFAQFFPQGGKYSFFLLPFVLIFNCACYLIPSVRQTPYVSYNISLHYFQFFPLLFNSTTIFMRLLYIFLMVCHNDVAGPSHQHIKPSALLPKLCTELYI